MINGTIGKILFVDALNLCLENPTGAASMVCNLSLQFLTFCLGIWRSFNAKIFNCYTQNFSNSHCTRNHFSGLFLQISLESQNYSTQDLLTGDLSTLKIVVTLDSKTFVSSLN